MIQVLFAGRPAQWDAYAPHLRAALAEFGVEAELVNQTDTPKDIDYIAYSPLGQVQDFTPFTKVKAVLSLWAGVEAVINNPTLTQPLARMVDPGLTEGMVEWVTGHVLRYHLDMDRHIHGTGGIWLSDAVPPLARHRHIAMLGLGALGAACAKALIALNFQVSGWSRTPKDIPGVQCHSGKDGLRHVLSGAEIAVLLLPATPATENLINKERLGWMPKGARIINPGRGGLIDDAALMAALTSGMLDHATLDVFRQEPLPPDSPYWHHPKVTVTPHIASETRAASAARVIAENVARGEAGEPFLHLVDRVQGY